MGKKILVAYATAGIGHKKAAIAAMESIESANMGHEVRGIDVLDYTNSFFKTYYPRGYVFLINRLIWLWAFFYFLLDLRLCHRFFYPLRCFLHVISSARLITFMRRYRPDLVISTHFLMPDVCEYLKKKYGMKTHVVSIITDYRAHSFWISKGVDSYFVAHDETKNDLVLKWRVDPGCVRVTGIPVGRKFYMGHSKDFFRKKLGIPKGDMVILLMSGGYAMGPVFGMIRLMGALDAPVSIIAVCGHNEPLRQKIETIKGTLKRNILNLGYVDNVDELMAASDIYVGKAGGISVTEAVMMGLPMALVRPIPGQESRNADLMVRRGIAAIHRGPRETVRFLKRAAENRLFLKKMEQAVGRVREKTDARDIAKMVDRVLS